MSIEGGESNRYTVGEGYGRDSVNVIIYGRQNIILWI